MIGIYKIENKVNGKAYIGQSVDIAKRWREHCNQLNKDDHYNIYLQSAWNKYGKENFVFSVQEYCSNEELNDREVFWIKFYNSCNREFGYNLAPGGECGYKIPDMIVDKIYSLSNDGFLSSEIAKELDLDSQTIRKYLKLGTKNGDCNFDSKKEQKIRHSKKIVCLNTREIFDSITSAEQRYGIHGLYEAPMHIVDYNGRDENGNELFWLYYDEYISMSEQELEEYYHNLQLKFDKRVICLNTLKIFDKQSEAIAYAGVKKFTSIQSCCNGNKLSCGKDSISGERLRWMYYKDYIKIYGEVA